jgi:molybdopterin-guanine dinucleotide biosynthesis protein A
MKLNLPCFILAGGKSSRFGNEKDDKAFLFYENQYRLCKKTFKKVFFAAKRKKFKNYPFFIEKSKEYAPFFALEEIVKKHKKVFVLSVDTPLITEKSLRKLALKKATASNNPLIGYYDYSMLKNFDEKTKKIFPINKRKIKIKEKETINVNTLKDLSLLPNKIGKRIEIKKFGSVRRG